MKSKFKPVIGIYSILNGLALMIMLTLNTLAVVLPLNGYATGALSDLYPNLFVPAGITFSIWGLLYVCLTGFVILGNAMERSTTHHHKNPLRQIAPLFILSCLFNGAWIIAWHYLRVFESLVIMLCLLLVLAMLYEQVRNLRFNTVLEKFFIKGTSSLYLGWISVATIANVVAYWVSLKPETYGLSESIWTMAVIAVATLLGLFFAFKYNDYLYGSVILWAFYGIYLKHTTTFNGDYPNIILTTQIAMLLMGMAILYALIQSFRTTPAR